MQLWLLSSQIASTTAPAVPKTRKKQDFITTWTKQFCFGQETNLGSANLGVGDATVNLLPSPILLDFCSALSPAHANPEKINSHPTGLSNKT